MKEETIEQLKARIRKEDAEVLTARAKKIDDSLSTTRGVNEAYFANQEALAAQAAVQNAKNHAAQKTQEQINAESIAAAKAAYAYKPYAPVTPKGRPSISLPTVPEKYSSSDPRRGMDEDLIIRMGMNPDSRKSPFSK